MRKKLGSVILILTIVTATACSAAVGPALTGVSSETTGSALSRPSGNGSDEEPDPAEDPDEPPPGSATDTVIEAPDSTEPVQETTDTEPSSDEVISTDAKPSEESPEETPEEPGDEEPADPGDEDPAGDDMEIQGSGEPATPGDAASEEDPPGDQEVIRSNLPPELKLELDKPENGILLIYHPEEYEEIKAITRWTVVEFETDTQLLLVTKAKGSIVEIAAAEFTDDERIVIPGEVIRNWQTTSDYEVIRIHYTDAETIPLNFIRVRQPDGRVTVTPLQTSSKDDYDWLSFQYEE